MSEKIDFSYPVENPTMQNLFSILELLLSEPDKTRFMIELDSIRSTTIIQKKINKIIETENLPISITSLINATSILLTREKEPYIPIIVNVIKL